MKKSELVRETTRVGLNMPGVRDVNVNRPDQG